MEQPVEQVQMVMRLLALYQAEQVAKEQKQAEPWR
jgi:hypothetical protein